MLWIDYKILQMEKNLTVFGDSDQEVLNKGLFSVGDIFVVDENGTLVYSGNKHEEEQWKT